MDTWTPFSNELHSSLLDILGGEEMCPPPWVVRGGGDFFLKGIRTLGMGTCVSVAGMGMCISVGTGMKAVWLCVLEWGRVSVWLCVLEWGHVSVWLCVLEWGRVSIRLCVRTYKHSLKR